MSPIEILFDFITAKVKAGRGAPVIWYIQATGGGSLQEQVLVRLYHVPLPLNHRLPARGRVQQLYLLNSSVQEANAQV